MRWAASVALLALLWSTGSIAAELTPLIDDQRLGAALRDLRLPETLRKDLKSGLTNRLLIRVTLLARSETLAQRAVELSVKYDLWDEIFRLRTTVDGATVSSTTVARVEEAARFLSDAQLPRLFTRNATAPSTALVLKAEVLLNPLDRERMDAIRKWVAQNTTPPDAAGIGSNAPTTGANALFNRIFEQYASGTDVAAAWKETLSSQPFQWEPAHDGR